jgi:hypothetical protein
MGGQASGLHNQNVVEMIPSRFSRAAQRNMYRHLLLYQCTGGASCRFSVPVPAILPPIRCGPVDKDHVVSIICLLIGPSNRDSQPPVYSANLERSSAALVGIYPTLSTCVCCKLYRWRCPPSPPHIRRLYVASIRLRSLLRTKQPFDLETCNRDRCFRPPTTRLCQHYTHDVERLRPQANAILRSFGRSCRPRKRPQSRPR